MNTTVAIIGGGLAGLALSIDLKRKGHDVMVIEKGAYPKHKVCGEYLSMESHRYLHEICPALSCLDLPKINSLKISSTGKAEYKTPLAQGGFGISRYLLEEMLYQESRKNGVLFRLNTKALSIQFNCQDELYTIQTSTETVHASFVCDATGRKSNLESKVKISPLPEVNYVGVKYHIKVNRDPSLIEIHHFPGGYCGISDIEDNKSCLCYMVNSDRLHAAGNSIATLESTYLFQNKNLHSLFHSAEFLFDEPVTVSGISFKMKRPVDQNIFYAGDSAGCISPITGNGMSLALHAASILSHTIHQCLSGIISKKQAYAAYNTLWRKEFFHRIQTGRLLQKLTENPVFTNLTINLFNTVPFFGKQTIKKTYGNPF